MLLRQRLLFLSLRDGFSVLQNPVKIKGCAVCGKVKGCLCKVKQKLK